MMVCGRARELRVLQPVARLADPHVWTDNRGLLSIRWALYEPLVRYGEGGNHRPVLAAGWTVSPDARTWVFHLREAVSFHSGDRLTAWDVVASLDRARCPAMAGELGTSGLFQGYLGSVQVEALNDQVVRITLKEPMADLLDLLMEIPVIPKSWVDEPAGAPVGTGPHRLLDAGPEHVLVEVFRGYWGGSTSSCPVLWQAEPDPDQRIERLLAGDADLVTDVPPQRKEQLISRTSVEVVEAPSSVCVVFMCNARSGPCSDRRVRQALHYALDVQEIVNAVKDGAGQPLNGPLTPLHLGFDPTVPPYPYDPNMAQRLLAEAGYARGLQLTLDIPTSVPDEAPQLAEIAREQFARIGLTTEIHVIHDRSEYAERVKRKAIHDACCFDSSPLSTYRVLREKFHSRVQGPWWQGYHNPRVDELLDRAWSTPDRKHRQKLYRRAYRIIRDDAPWLFLYSPTLLWGVGPRGRGWQPDVEGTVPTRP